MKILFLNLSHLKFTVETPLHQPLGGTESALAYLSTALAARGHDVSLMCLCERQDINGVHHIPVALENLILFQPDIAIIASAPEAWPKMKELLPNTKLVLWNHMLPNQPSMAHLFNPAVQSLIKHMVFVSESQKSSFLASIPGRAPVQVPDMHVIGNAISPPFENLFPDAEALSQAKECKGAYTSTPYRGLACLAKIKELHIDVFSSMAVYQDSEDSYKTMYENLRQNECLALHGSVSQTELAQRLKSAAFLIYPSIFQECHSIALLEAMAAGCRVLTTDLGIDKRDSGLEDRDFVDVLPFASVTINEFAALIRKNTNTFRSHPELWAEKMFEQVQYINQNFTWKKKAEEWETYLQKILTEGTHAE